MSKIDVTHVGSLPRGPELVKPLLARDHGEDYDVEEFDRLVQAAIDDAVAKQVEAGVKLEHENVAGTLSVFRIQKANEFLDPATNIYSQDGLQENVGVELSAFGEPLPGVRFIAGLTWLDSELKDTAGGTLDGNKAGAIPSFQARLSAEWDIPQLLPGFTLTGAMIHAGSAWFDDQNTQKVPSWTRFDVGARYAFEVYDTPITARLSVENVADNDYWISSFSGGVTLSGPRAIILSLTAYLPID